MTLEEKYQQLLKIPSDVNEHFPLIRQCVSPGDIVLELGTRNIVSTYALMANKPAMLVSCDVVMPPEEKLVEAGEIADANGIKYRFIQGESQYADIKPYVDVLFIDTLHLYSQVVKELWRHAERTKKCIIFHDSGIHEVAACIQDFLFNLNWKLKAQLPNGTGIAVLERVGVTDFNYDVPTK